MRVVGSWGVLVVGAALALGCSKEAPLRNPLPVIAASSPAATEQAILDALPKRRWTAEDVQPGRIVAFLPIRTHLVRVEILYDSRSVRIGYMSSDNVGEYRGSDGQLYAHRNVNKWMQNLALDIQQSVALQGYQPATAGGAAPSLAPESSASAPPAQPFATVPVAPSSK
jgi:hypothetical protein